MQWNQCSAADLVRRNSLDTCFRRLWTDISCLYLEVFSFKLRPVWLDRLENYNPQVLKKLLNLHDFLLYMNVNISYSLRVCKNESQYVAGVNDGRHIFSSLVLIIQMWWIGTTILTHSVSEYATQADWVTESNTSLQSFEDSRCNWLNHTTWFHSNPALPRTILLHFILIYCIVIAMLAVWWSQKHGHISHYTSGILLSWKTKNQLVFFCINCEHLRPSSF